MEEFRNAILGDDSSFIPPSVKEPTVHFTVEISKLVMSLPHVNCPGCLEVCTYSLNSDIFRSFLTPHL